jgi:hypothetical protein
VLFLLALTAASPFAAPVAAQQPPTAPAAAESAARGGEPKLVFDREVFSYPGENRRDPFRPLTHQEDLGPVFNDLRLRMIIYSGDPKQSIVVVADASNKVYRLRHGQSLGNVTVVDIAQTRVVFSVDDFGIRRQEVLDLKSRKPSEGA